MRTDIYVFHHASPRSFTFDPKASQIVRVQLRKPKDFPPGEYRARMRVIGAPPKSDTPIACLLAAIM
jgi:hypothetical protein